jgi:hypothetical protein
VSRRVLIGLLFALGLRFALACTQGAPGGGVGTVICSLIGSAVNGAAGAPLVDCTDSGSSSTFGGPLNQSEAVATAPGGICAADRGDNACTACVKSRCCAPTLACLGDEGCKCLVTCESKGDHGRHGELRPRRLRGGVLGVRAVTRPRPCRSPCAAVPARSAPSCSSRRSPRSPSAAGIPLPLPAPPRRGRSSSTAQRARLYVLRRRTAVRGLDIPADIVPCTRSEFEEEKHEIDTLARAAFLRGRRIYERRA